MSDNLRLIRIEPYPTIRQMNARKERKVRLDLFICPTCRRVWQKIGQTSGHKRNYQYLPSWFPKRQHERQCEQCEKSQKK